MNETIVKKETYISPKVEIYELLPDSIMTGSITGPRDNENFEGRWE